MAEAPPSTSKKAAQTAADLAMEAQQVATVLLQLEETKRVQDASHSDLEVLPEA